VEAAEKLGPEALRILTQPETLKNLTEKISQMEQHDSALEIVNEIFRHITQ
jgi:exonuclease VII small subunit